MIPLNKTTDQQIIKVGIELCKYLKTDNRNLFFILYDQKDGLTSTQPLTNPNYGGNISIIGEYHYDQKNLINPHTEGFCVEIIRQMVIDFNSKL